jgi:glyoxylase-like metal-dependent hydrolase (beta-lactamase superfamily II)
MTPQFLHAANPGPMTGEGNWTYLIGRERPLLIDAGVGNESHLDAIAKAAPNGLDHLVVTHAHSDHIAGAPAIQDRWPNAKLSKYPWSIRDRDLPWQPLNDGDVIATDEGDLQVLLTPGHAPDHVSLWHPGSRTIFVGDMMQQGNTVVILASHGGSLTDYIRSLERIAALNPARALPAHGPVIEDPLALIQRYVSHRAQREVQILEALAAKHDTVESITEHVYPILQDALVPMARESVLAHLQKLQTERRVVNDGPRWSLVR